MKTVTFKSLPDIFAKEKDGRKPNTLGMLDDLDTRFAELLNGTATHITILNTHTGEEFTREITDVTEWDGYLIISWKVQK
jgi:hypothetical protein